jgi:UDP-N-acetylglucosamine 2-epimerase (non-hydrolysing)
MKLAVLVGARPNFIKITQFPKLSLEYKFDLSIIHSGQHFDFGLSEIFFDELNLKPRFFLNAQNLNPLNQLADILHKLNTLFTEKGKPDLLIVPGDVNTTLAGAIVANKMGIPLAHLEAGLRSFDLEMPEEHNRKITDLLSDYLFITEESGLKNLENENVLGKKYFVGNTMIDSLIEFNSLIKGSKILEILNLQQAGYILATIHRPSNVDTPQGLKNIVSLFNELALIERIVVPLHPRTRNNLGKYDFGRIFLNSKNILITEPLGYLDFQNLVSNAKVVITDSGGIQEETTFRKIPCITLRKNTERPITITKGTNTLMDIDVNSILKVIDSINLKSYKAGEIPPLWDGKATERIFKLIKDLHK